MSDTPTTDLSFTWYDFKMFVLAINTEAQKGETNFSVNTSEQNINFTVTGAPVVQRTDVSVVESTHGEDQSKTTSS
jgi:hypothetical protein